MLLRILESGTPEEFEKIGNILVNLQSIVENCPSFARYARD